MDLIDGPGGSGRVDGLTRSHVFGMDEVEVLPLLRPSVLGRRASLTAVPERRPLNVPRPDRAAAGMFRARQGVPAGCGVSRPARLGLVASREAREDGLRCGPVQAGAPERDDQVIGTWPANRKAIVW